MTGMLFVITILVLFAIFIILNIIFEVMQIRFIKPLSKDSLSLIQFTVERMPDTEENQKLYKKLNKAFRFYPLKITDEEVDRIMPYMPDYDKRDDSIENRKYKIARQELESIKRLDNAYSPCDR